MVAIVTFQGFTENLKWETGTEVVWREVIRPFASSEITVRWPDQWDTDTEALAGFCSRQGFKRVIIVGYSWGGGYAAQKFAGYLQDLGIKVPLMLLCDPVYRPLWLPRCLGPMSPLSVIGSPKIKVPENVRCVSWVRQTSTKPRGHDLAGTAELTHIEDPITLDHHSHTTIDHSIEWKAVVETCLTLTLKPTTQ